MRIAADWLMTPGARTVCALLAEGGHQAWFVGGCVRNAIIGAAATDIDITTDARPDRVMALAQAAGLRVVPTGFDHGTVTVVVDGAPYEVTTFRRDVETDGRHAVVAFADSLEQDAARRDFTMNALYADAEGAVRDPLGTGLSDLAARHVRFIGDPGDRIREDHLRILRFFRFHAWYGDPEGGVDAEGLAACADLSDGILALSRERIGAEMRKLLSAPDPAPAVAAMGMSGVLLRVLPGAGALTLTVLVHVEEAAGLAPDWLRRLASLGGEGAPEALRLSNAETRRLAALQEAMAADWPPAETGWRLGAGDGTGALALRAAMAGQEVDSMAALACAAGAQKQFPVKAADLMPALTGAALGAELKRLETLWLRSGLTLDRTALLAEAQKGT